MILCLLMTSTTQKKGRGQNEEFGDSLSGEVTLKQGPERVSEPGRQHVPTTTAITCADTHQLPMRPQTNRSALEDPCSRK